MYIMLGLLPELTLVKSLQIMSFLDVYNVWPPSTSCTKSIEANIPVFCPHDL